MDTYDIIVEGHLSQLWQSWFPGMTITNEENGITRISGSVRDQAELHGYILSIQDLGLILIGVERKEIDHTIPIG